MKAAGAPRPAVLPISSCYHVIVATQSAEEVPAGVSNRLWTTVPGGSRRLARILPFAVLLASAPSAHASQSWAHRQIAYLLHAGKLPHVQSPAAFHGSRPLSAPLLRSLVAGLPDAQGVPWLQQATADATIGELDNAFVTALGLRGVAADVARGLRNAGLQPPPGAGVEVVARTLGLRPNHPAGSESLERWPTEPATRAEAAYSAWRVLTFKGWERDNARDTLAHLSIPPGPEAVAGPLRLAVSHLGAPYVWGGASADDGGFDCSGLVVDAEGGEDRVGGRTTQEMAASIPAGGRIRLADVQPGDLVFFGPRGRKTPPRLIGHVGLALGNGWFVHASVRGVTLDRLDGSYYRANFAYARRLS
jgi:cell wall-associated NlpC family hydrolase